VNRPTTESSHRRYRSGGHDRCARVVPAPDSNTHHREDARTGDDLQSDRPTREHLASLGRPTLIIAGFATEVVVLHAALDALREGNSVIVAVHTCGGMSDRNRISGAGAPDNVPDRADASTRLICDRPINRHSPKLPVG
jgi:nicotinamidase-related amidase